MKWQHGIWAIALAAFVVALGCSSTHTKLGAEKAGQKDGKTASLEGQAEEPGSASSIRAEQTADPAAATPARDPKAEEMIQQLSRKAAERKNFRFKFVDEFDDVQAGGEKIQITHIRQGVVSRPNRIKLETTGDVANRTIVNDGKTVTLWDRDENIYTQLASPGTIDQTFDTLMDRYHTAVPAADLFYEDPGKTFLDQMVTSKYAGLSSVDGIECHHLAFTGTKFDWQVWIEADDTPALRKLVIDYKSLPGRPQYELRVLEMEPLMTVNATEFELKIPAGAEKVDIQPASQTENP